MESVHQYLLDFNLKYNEQGEKRTEYEEITLDGHKVSVYCNEFWTPKQRQASSIHEISYRACFKPQLPRFFIKLLTKADDIVYDPFSGRGTTPIEASLLGRKVISNDINPLSALLTRPRMDIPNIDEVRERLDAIPINLTLHADIDLSMFYHKMTESELMSLKHYLTSRKETGKEDRIDRWIRMVATNRLTGHSSGFFSVYTLPPNQATSPSRQEKINQKRNQIPPYRNVKKLILKKTKSLLRNVSEEEKKKLQKANASAVFIQKDARNTPDIPNDSVDLTVTSPPFLNVVAYDKDNWLRCWFNSINVDEISSKITMLKDIKKWRSFMNAHFRELYRLTKPGGWIAFEVGEVNKGRDNLDQYIFPVGTHAGFICKGILLNSQEFTKTSNIWGITNNQQGTNTNRIVLFRKKE